MDDEVEAPLDDLEAVAEDEAEDEEQALGDGAGSKVGYGTS